jgi:hypothetical protein
LFILLAWSLAYVVMMVWLDRRWDMHVANRDVRSVK